MSTKFHRSRLAKTLLLVTALLCFRLHSAAQVSPPTSHFACQLFQSYTNSAWLGGFTSWFGGSAYFRIEGNQLLFRLQVAEVFTNFSGVDLRTDSLQLRIDVGNGEPANLPVCDPVLSSGTNAPSGWNGCGGFFSAMVYNGAVPLTRTLMSELLLGQGEIRLFIPGTVQSNQWNRPPPVSGKLVPLLGANIEQATAFPRHPRSVNAVSKLGIVPLPMIESTGFNLDLNGDGRDDFRAVGGARTTLTEPGSANYWFGLSCLESNQVLTIGTASAILFPEDLIGSQPPDGSSWTRANEIRLSDCGLGQAYRPWSGELGRRGEGYLGARIRLPDGDRYGWIRVRLPRGRYSFPYIPILGEPTPTSLAGGGSIEEWAFEPEPGKPIKAGARTFVVGSQIQPTTTPGKLRFSFPTDTGRAYQLQQRPSLGLGGWSNFGFNFIGSSAPQTIELPTTGSSGFFRVLEAD